MGCDCGEVCGFSCGSCGGQDQCLDGCHCECVPQCGGKECGDGGCPGQPDACGTCGVAEFCESGQCKVFSCPAGFVKVMPGEFQMGAPADEPGVTWEESLHAQVVDRGFCIKSKEVTQADWKSLMGSNPSTYPVCGSSCPVESVTWWDAAAWCNARSSAEGLEQCYDLSSCSGSGADFECSDWIDSKGTACKGYRLPTQVEWEYAARAGTTGPTYVGKVDLAHDQCEPGAALASIAWYCANSAVTYDGFYICEMNGGPKECGPQPVGKLAANAWGLFDMHGNVSEWCDDRSGGSSGHAQAVRGCSWGETAASCRAARINVSFADFRSPFQGFRPVRSFP